MSNQASHTPTPWTIENDIVVIHRTEGGKRIQVAECETAEDARLIAAVPDLLEAHQKSDDLCQHMSEIEQGEWSTAQIVDLLVEIQNNSRAAIARAEGRA